MNVLARLEPLFLTAHWKSGSGELVSWSIHVAEWGLRMSCTVSDSRWRNPHVDQETEICPPAGRKFILCKEILGQPTLGCIHFFLKPRLCLYGKKNIWKVQVNTFSHSTSSFYSSCRSNLKYCKVHACFAFPLLSEFQDLWDGTYMPFILN